MALSRLLGEVKGYLRIHNLLARQCLAEFLGVFVLLVCRVMGEGWEKGGGQRFLLPPGLLSASPFFSIFNHFSFPFLLISPLSSFFFPLPTLISSLASLLSPSSSTSLPFHLSASLLPLPAFCLCSGPLSCWSPGFPWSSLLSPQLITQGSVAQAVTSEERVGNFFTMFLGGALAVIIAIYVGGNVSGEEGLRRKAM